MRNPTKNKSTESILLTTEHFHYNYEIILFQKLSEKTVWQGEEISQTNAKMIQMKTLNCQILR